MKAENQIYFKNRSLRRIYITVPLTIIGLFTFFYFVVGKDLGFAISVIIPSLFIVLFLPIKYSISDRNTIEFYHLFGRTKRLSIPIENISEVLVKPHRLSIDYKLGEDFYPRPAVLELSETDAKTVIDELLRRNPKIIVS